MKSVPGMNCSISLAVLRMAECEASASLLVSVILTEAAPPDCMPLIVPPAIWPSFVDLMVALPE